VREAQRIVALGDADLAKILGPRCMRPQVVGGQHREAGIWPARAIGIDGVAGELAEIGGVLPERIGMVGVGGDASDNTGIAALHGACGAAQGDDAARPAHRNVIEPARRQAEMLGQPDRRVGRQAEAGDAKPVDAILVDAGASQSLRQGAGEEPVRPADRVTHIGHGDRHGQSDIVIRGAVRSHLSLAYTMPPPR